MRVVPFVCVVHARSAHQANFAYLDSYGIAWDFMVVNGNKGGILWEYLGRVVFIYQYIVFMGKARAYIGNFAGHKKKPFRVDERSPN